MQQYMLKSTDSCLLNTQTSVIFIDSICFVLHGTAEIIFAGYWLGDNSNFRGLFQVDILQELRMKEGVNDTWNLTLVKNMLDGLDRQALYHAFLGAMEMNLAFFICCASCCALTRMLRTLCVLCVLLLLHNGGLLIWDILRLDAVDGTVEVLKEVFLFNLKTLYNDTSSTDNAVATFTYEMNGAQVMKKCCGVRDYRDYENASIWKAGVGMNLTVPPTCCQLHEDAFLFFNYLALNHENCVYQPMPNNSYLWQGCFKFILENLKYRLQNNAVLWDSLSTFLYFLTIFLFVCQIHLYHKSTDPLEAIRHGRFLDDTREVAEQMSLSTSLMTLTVEEKRQISDQ